MTVYELDSELRLGESGIKIHQDAAAYNAKIEYWLNIQQGDFWGKPWWGSSLKQFQFLFPSQTVLSVLEMEISESIENDIGITVLNITCQKSTSTSTIFKINLVYQVNKTGEIANYNDNFLKAA